MRIACTHRKFPAIQYMIEAIPQVGLHLALSVYMGEDTISKSVQVYCETESSTYRTEGRMWVATLWDRKMAPIHYGTKRMWVHMGQKGCWYTIGQKEGRGYTIGHENGTNTLWDKKDVGILWDRRKAEGTL